MTVVQRASQAKPHSVDPRQQPAFTAFPEFTLLESGKVPIGHQSDRWDKLLMA